MSDNNNVNKTEEVDLIQLFNYFGKQIGRIINSIKGIFNTIFKSIIFSILFSKNML